MIKKSELRKDYIQDKYVIIAPRRSQRPNTHKTKKLGVRKNKEDQNCPFCPINVNKVKDLFTIGPKNNWQVKVIKNIFPAVSLDNNKAYGQQEVIIDTPKHSLEIENLSIKQIVRIFDAYSERTKIISKNKKISYIIIFKNNGGVAGASLEHSHSQIFATNFIPPHLADKSQKQQEYKLKYGTCIYCDVIKKELKWEESTVGKEHTDCKINPVKCYLRQQRWGFGSKTQKLAALVRDGQMTRHAALNLVKGEDEEPKELSYLLDRLGLTQSHLAQIKQSYHLRYL